MAASKTIRSNSLPQPQRRRRNSQPHPHLKAELFDTLRQLNRGYGVALAALSRLGADKNASPRFTGIFPARCLRAHRHRTEALRALVNQELLRFVAGRKQQDAYCFDRLSRLAPKPSPKTSRS